jgi:hypothetical protein
LQSSIDSASLQEDSNIPYEWAAEEDFEEVFEATINLDGMNGSWVSKSDPIELIISNSELAQFSKSKLSKLNIRKATDLDHTNYVIESDHLEFIDKYGTHYMIFWSPNSDSDNLAVWAQHAKHKKIEIVKFYRKPEIKQ